MRILLLVLLSLVGCATEAPPPPITAREAFDAALAKDGQVAFTDGANRLEFNPDGTGAYFCPLADAHQNYIAGELRYAAKYSLNESRELTFQFGRSKATLDLMYEGARLVLGRRTVPAQPNEVTYWQWLPEQWKDPRLLEKFVGLEIRELSETEQFEASALAAKVVSANSDLKPIFGGNTWYVWRPTQVDAALIVMQGRMFPEQYSIARIMLLDGYGNLIASRDLWFYDAALQNVVYTETPDSLPLVRFDLFGDAGPFDRHCLISDIVKNSTNNQAE